MSKVATKAKKPSAKSTPRQSNSSKKAPAHERSPKSPPPAASADAEATARSTKRDQVLELLHTGDGATIQEIAAATEWQTHSVRGFLTGVVRKKLGLNLISTKTDRGRIYRINDKSSGARGVKASKKRA